MEYLNWLPDCIAYKSPVIRVYDLKKQIYRKPNNPYLPVGISDITGIYRERPLYIEVKTPQRRSRTTEEQKYFLSKMKEYGAIAFVATSIEDVKRELGIGIQNEE